MCPVELRRPVQGGLAPDRREPTAEGGTAKPVVRALEPFAGLRMPPHHHVGVGAQPGHVVQAADHHVLSGQLGEQLLDLGRLGGAVGLAQRETPAGTPTTWCSG